MIRKNSEALTFFAFFCYNTCGCPFRDIQVLLEIQRSALARGGQTSGPLSVREGVNAMVTYEELIQIGILVVSIVNLFVQVKKK